MLHRCSCLDVQLRLRTQSIAAMMLGANTVAVRQSEMRVLSFIFWLKLVALTRLAVSLCVKDTFSDTCQVAKLR